MEVGMRGTSRQVTGPPIRFHRAVRSSLRVWSQDGRSGIKISAVVLLTLLMLVPSGVFGGSYGPASLNLTRSKVAAADSTAPRGTAAPPRRATASSNPPSVWTNITPYMGEPGAGPTFTPWAAYYPPMKALILISARYVDTNPNGTLNYGNTSWRGPLSMWSFRDGVWTNITPQVTGSWPVPSGGMAGLAYDPPTQSLIMTAFTPAPEPGSNCTAWSFRNFEWTNLGSAPVFSPVPFPGFWQGDSGGSGNTTFSMGGQSLGLLGLTFDPGLGGVITVGGTQTLNRTSGLPVGNDTTWGIVNDTWINLTSRLGTEPPAIEYAGNQLAYDPGSGCIVSISSGWMWFMARYGANNTSRTLPRIETWQLCDGNWSYVATNSTLPNALPDRNAGPFIYDPQLGGDLDWGASNDSWLFTNGTWTRVNWTNPAPPPTMATTGINYLDAMVYDPSDSYLFLLGGSFGIQYQEINPRLVLSLPWSAHLAYGFGQLPPFLTLTADPTVGEVGADLTITTSVTGGVLPFTFEYSGLPPGCQSANQSQIECQPTVTGNFTVEATLVDGMGRVARASISVLVGPPPTVALEVSKSVTDVGRTVELRLVVSEGTPPYLYGYTGLPFGCTSQNAAVVNCTPEETGAYSVMGAVTDAEGSVRSASVNLMVNGDPSVQLTSSRGSLDEGQTVELKAAVVGGTGPFDWSYEGLPPGCRSVDAANLTCRPTAPGSYRVEVVVNDSVGVEVRGSVTFGVWPPLTVELGRVGPKAAEIGQTVEWRVGITGGLGPYTTQVDGLAGAVASGGNVSWTATGIGNYTLTVRVTDSNGGVAMVEANLTVVHAASPPPPSDGVWAAVGLGVAGLTVAAIWMVQRRRP